MDESTRSSHLWQPPPHRAKRLPQAILMTTALCVLTSVVNLGTSCLALDNACIRRHARNLGIGWSDGYHTCRYSGPRHHADLPPTGYSDPKCSNPCGSQCQDWCVQPCDSIVDCQPCLGRCCKLPDWLQKKPDWLPKKPCSADCDGAPIPVTSCDEMGCDKVPEPSSVVITAQPQASQPQASPSWVAALPEIESPTVDFTAEHVATPTISLPRSPIRRLPSTISGLPSTISGLPSTIATQDVQSIQLKVTERPTAPGTVRRIR